MRRTKFLSALAVFVFSACNQQIIDSPAIKGEGEVIIRLSADEKLEIVSAKSGTQDNLPDLRDFWIELVNSEDVKFKREKYADVEGKRIGMNAGEFTFMAKHGDSLGVGFDKPFYMAKKKFIVEPQKLLELDAVAKLANVKVAVVYGEQIKNDYTGFYTVVKHAVHKKTSLTFNSDESRAGYIPGGKMTVTVYAMVEGALKCFTLKDENGEPAVIDAAPNDFITFNVNTGVNYGGLSVSMKIDNSTEPVEKVFEVPADAALTTKPSVTVSGCDDERCYYITEGIQGAPADLGFTYKVYSGVKKCEFVVSSPYLKGLGVPEVIDVRNMTPDLLSSLEKLGFFFAGTSNIGVIGIEDIVYKYGADAKYNGGGVPTEMGTFTINIADEEGNTVSETIKVYVMPDAEAVIRLNDHDIWATKVVNPTVSVSKGNISLMKVQSSLNGNDWDDFRNVTSTDFQIGTVTGLQPSTRYYLRVVYDDWMEISDVFSFTTEAAQQVGNAGFEDWTSHVYETNYDDITWYQPWTSDQWWDTNTTVTLRSSLTAGYLYFKSFPCVQYSVDSHSGGKSAQLTCVNVGNENSEWGTNGGWRVGELFIGRGDEAKELNTFNRITDGHAFSSRPSSMTFWYEYVPYTSSDAFSAEISVKSSDGTVLATSYATGTSKSSWTQMTLPLNYAVNDKKAASIHITFRSSVSSTHDCEVHGFMDFSQDGPYLEIAGSTKTGDNGQIKLSATLRIDDVQLNY